MTFRDVARAAHRRATEPIGSIQRVADIEGQFVLTYDDGPDPRYTPGILEALRDFNATATFFVLLSKVDRNPNLLREVKAAGHEIALHGFTKSTALEGATFGIRVNAICPGYVRTPLVENQIADTAKARGISEESVVKDVLLAAQPTKEFVKVSDVAALAVFLTGEAANQINGAALSIDGGWVAQ